MQQLDALTLSFRQAIQLQSFAGDFQGAMRHIRADDLLELFFFQ